MYMFPRDTVYFREPGTGHLALSDMNSSHIESGHNISQASATAAAVRRAHGWYFVD